MVDRVGRSATAGGHDHDTTCAETSSKLWCEVTGSFAERWCIFMTETAHKRAVYLFCLIYFLPFWTNSLTLPTLHNKFQFLELTRFPRCKKRKTICRVLLLINSVYEVKVYSYQFLQRRRHKSKCSSSKDLTDNF